MHNKTIPYVKKNIQKREQQRNRTIHLEHLRRIRPQQDTEINPVILNNRKKDFVLESKFTEIQRENRILLEKITGIFSKKGRGYSSEPAAKSLNINTRRKRLQDIQQSNARLLKRLQQRKSDYDVDKMRKDWRRQKQVAKNISSYPEKLKPLTAVTRHHESHYVEPDRSPFDVNKTYELSKVKVIDWYTFHVVVKLDRNGLTITANNSSSRDLKVIQIERGEALDFLRNQCQNKLEKVFERLRYDGTNMLLVGENAEEQINGILGEKQKVEEEEEHQQDIRQKTDRSRSGAKSTTPKIQNKQIQDELAQ